MARKKSLYESKSADTCPCGCCKWHSSKAVRGVLALMFILIVSAFVASIVFSDASGFYSSSTFSFMGVIFLLVFVGWGFILFCSCRGLHWSRHGYDWLDNSRMTARRRYAEGEISRKDYTKMMDDLK